MRLKNKIIILIIAIIVYMLLTYIYNNYVVSQNMKEAYIIVNNVKRGDKITSQNTKLVKYESNINSSNLYSNNEVGIYVFKEDYNQGDMLTKDMLIEEEKYNDIELETEVVAVKIDKLEDNIASKLKKGDIVNMYVSAATSEITNLLNVENVESFSNNLKDGVTTVKLLEKVEIINCYDSSGNKIEKNNVNIETVTFRLKKDDVIKINNLKNYAVFSLTLSS